MAEAMDDLQEGMARVTEIHEAYNAAPRPVGVTCRFDFPDEDTAMGEARASAAEGDTEGGKTQEAEDDGGANMNDWNEGEHAPNIRKEVEKAWSKLSKVAKQKNTKANGSA
jgi:hypothetical protein